MRLRTLLGTAVLTAALVTPAAASAAPAAPATPTAPSVPRTPAVAPGHGQVTVTWSAPASTGGSPITAYRVRVVPDGRTVTVAAPAGTATVTGLADGTSVTATVVAINQVGTSPTANAGSAIPVPPITIVSTASQTSGLRDVATALDGTTYLATDDEIVQLADDGTKTPLDLGPVAPLALAFASDGSLLWIDEAPATAGWTVRRLHGGVVTTVAGGGNPDDGYEPPTSPIPAVDTVLASPLDLAVSPVDGSIFLVDYLCGVVERFTIGGDLAVVAGDAASGSCSSLSSSSSGDGGPATAARLHGPQGVAVDEAGTVYVSEMRADRVRGFTVGGTITTVAGDGTETIDPGADLDAASTGVPYPARIAWLPGRGLLIDSGGRLRLLVGDRLQRIGGNAFDHELLGLTTSTGDGPFGSNEIINGIAWDGTTLHLVMRLRTAGGGFHEDVRAIGPWSPATAPTEHPGFGSWSDLVLLHHRAILGRPPTTAEHGTWVAALRAGATTPGQLDDALRRSTENAANVDPIVRLYRAFLGRAPDAGGLRFWIGRKRNVAPARTWKVSDLAAQFVGSSEFQRKYGSLSNRAWVTQIYTDVLGRPADQGGVDFWTKRLDTKRQDRAQVMVGFSESSEYRRKQAANTDAAVAYLDLVGRMPTPAETAAWATAAAAGTTHVELLDALIAAAPKLV